MRKIYWRITYKQKGKEFDYGCFSKKEMIIEYLKLLEQPYENDISELKIWKNDIDYTATLNRFLMN